MPNNLVLHIVDDDEAVRRSLVFLFSSAGYAVRPHASATDFLAVAPALEKHCLLVDLHMPDMSGLELLRRLRDAGASLPSVVITGNGDVKTAVEAMKLGAVDFVEKPFRETELFDAIERAAYQALAEFNSGQTRMLMTSRLETLSKREQQVLDGILVGLTTKGIALEHSLSPRTVEVYRTSLMAKMHAGSLSELVRMALAAGYKSSKIEPT